MSFELAKEILGKELEKFSKTHVEGERFAIEFFGGEPLLNFTLIRQIYAWIKTQDIKFPYVFQITTNGTLLTDEVKQWLTEHKEDFRVILSVDGDEMMQAKNRGCNIEDIPIAFVRDTWGKSYFKMTLSHDTLPKYADGIISLAKNGYKVASTLAEGIEWSMEEAGIYETELAKIAKFYLENPDSVPQHPFDYVYKELLGENNNRCTKNCGVGTSIITYDIDGKSYPCHLFLPIVHGRNEYDKIKSLDFTDNTKLVDKDCLDCPIRNLCRTCYGYNYLIRGDVACRDKTRCKMYLLEFKTISAFQVNYLVAKQKRGDGLTDDELLMLKAAVKCYEITKDFSYENF